MATLAPADIVAVWEAGSALPDWGKALAMLAPMFPEAKPSALARLSLGQRNAHLLALRGGTIGPAMQAVVRCPECAEPLEFEQRVDELLEGYAAPAAKDLRFADTTHDVRYRLLTSEDLRAAADALDAVSARLTLIARAVIEARIDGEAVAAEALPEPVLLAIGEAMAANDPLARIAIPIACAACAHVWATDLEIVAYFWAELERKARYLLEDVVKLAHGYGWNERDILAMSEARRQFYIAALD